ncbi:MAG: retron system putative HNH endonuclease [Chitinophagales bacterium]
MEIIKVDRIAKPDILVKKAKLWTDDYLQACADYEKMPDAKNKTKKRNCEKKYNHAKVKVQLKKMFEGKCAYCESHITHIDYGDIEHFRPKSKFSKLCFEWSNFLLACGVCNGAAHKGNKFPEKDGQAMFVNPVEEEPNDLFKFEYDVKTGTANVLPKNDRGKVTESIIGLNRAELVTHRSKIVRYLAFIAIKASKGDVEAKKILFDACDKKSEYAAFARTLAKKFDIS